LLLTDARGQVVDRRAADTGILTRLDRIELAPGFLYSEDLIGTNAIGTAITQRGPAVVTGTEHFADALSLMACAATPVTDGAGQIIGVIDLTCAAEDFNPMLLPFAKRTAREIGQRFREGTNPRSPQPSGWLNLTDTERTVAHLATQGLTSRSVTDRMLLSQPTVRSHLRHVFRKLGVRSTVELARIAQSVREISHGIYPAILAQGETARAEQEACVVSKPSRRCLSPGACGLSDFLSRASDLPAQFPAPGSGIVPPVLLGRPGAPGWYRDRPPVGAHRNHREVAAVGVPDDMAQQVLRRHSYPDLHRRTACPVDAGLQRHEFTDVDGLPEDDLVDGERDGVVPRIAGRAGIRDLVEVLQQKAAVDVAGEVRHIRGHQDGHRQAVQTVAPVVTGQVVGTPAWRGHGCSLLCGAGRPRVRSDGWASDFGTGSAAILGLTGNWA
jgi:DNA-binding CsgD family transcriptional regulator